MYRQARNVDKLLPAFRVALSNFLGRAPLEESTIIFDGPGLGCTSHIVLLALIGMDRLIRLRAVNFFSSSGYAGFVLDAKQRQQLIINREDVAGLNLRNQRRHGIRFLLTSLGFLGSKLVCKRWYFRNHLLSDFLRSIVTDYYADSTIEDLPANFHFWTFDETTRQFCDIHSHSRYSHWTPSEVISSLVAVPWLFEPLEKEGRIFSDALSAHGVRDVFRNLRYDSNNVLFWHMNQDGRRANTLFIKGHQIRSGLTRVASDFALFLLGIENPEFARSIELGLFDITDE
jgi:hypothetical protein